MWADSPILRKIVLPGLVLGLLLAWWLRRPNGEPASRSGHAAPAASHELHRQRARNDLSGLAKAFSAVAARTIGLIMVSGKVLDRASGLPIANAEVVFSGPAGETSVACNGEGLYQVELEPGFYRSYARAENYVAVAPQAAERLPGPISAAAVAMPREGIAPLAGLFRDQVGVNLSLSPGATLRGQVIDTEGRPIAGAIVAARGQGQLRVISGDDVSESDGSGQFELKVPAGSIDLEASHEDYAGLRYANRLYLQAGDLREGHTLVMDSGCIVEGRVVDAEGHRVESGAFEQQISPELFAPIGEIEAGRVRFVSTSEGSVVLRAWPWQHAPSASKEYRCTAGDHYRDELFVIPDAEPALTGTVQDDDAAPVGYAFIDLFSLTAGGATQQERADDNGNFSFFNLAEGPYQLSVYVPGKGATVEIIDVPSTGVPLRLGGVGSMIGSVTGIEFGSMMMDYRCQFRLSESESAQRDALSMPMQHLLVPLDRGRFRIDDLPACPLEGRVSVGDIVEGFSLDIQRGQEALLRIGE